MRPSCRIVCANSSGCSNNCCSTGSNAAASSLRRCSVHAVLMHPRRYLLQHAERLDMLHMRLNGSMRAALNQSREKRLRIHHGLMRYHPQEQLSYAKKRNEASRKQLVALMQSILKHRQSQLRESVRHLDALSPLKVMARGYSLVYDEKEQHLIKSINDVQPGDLVQIKVSDGQLSCQVWGMKEDGQVDGKG